jgi:hypothetical protein
MSRRKSANLTNGLSALGYGELEGHRGASHDPWNHARSPLQFPLSLKISLINCRDVLHRTIGPAGGRRVGNSGRDRRFHRKVVAAREDADIPHSSRKKYLRRK